MDLCPRERQYKSDENRYFTRKAHKKAIWDHVRPYDAIEGKNRPYKTIQGPIMSYKSIQCLNVPQKPLKTFLFPCTIFVRFGTFFTHVSTPRRRRRTTTTTSKLLLGPLNIARGQIFFCRLPDYYPIYNLPSPKEGIISRYFSFHISLTWWLSGGNILNCYFYFTSHCLSHEIAEKNIYSWTRK